MQRRNFIKNMAALPFLFSTFNLNQFEKMSQDFEKTAKLPVLFIGHGHPMNAILDNDFTQSLKKLGQVIQKPKAVLMISAHWETRGTYVSTNPSPKTIYDFGRFDDRLFDIKYEPQGRPELAKLLQDEVDLVDVQADPNMGLDHGAWTVLKFIFPQQDVPVFQMSNEPIQHIFEGYQSGSISMRCVQFG